MTATGRSRLLARYTFESEDWEQGATAAATAGPYAALATFSTLLHYGGSGDKLAVYDLRTGMLVKRLGGEQVTCDGYSCLTYMDELAINAAGDTAVHTDQTLCPQFASGCEQIQADDSTGVHIIDQAASTSPFQADSSPTLTNLALIKNTLTWQHAGTSQTTTLH
ncbi:MAG: hypothetical protein ABI355_19610 [Solirubrobacteraceae bacterium]